MAIDYSLFAIPKTRVKALDKAEKQRAIAATDKRENAKAKERANGRCEVRERARFGHLRCEHKDTQTHHLKGGIGRRNRGDSILAINKLRVCAECHTAITANILRTTTATHDAITVRYWRAK